MISLQQHRDEQAFQQQQSRESDAMRLFREKHPEFDMQANESVLRSYLKECSEDINLPNLEDAVSILGPSLARKSQEQVQEFRQEQAEERAEALEQTRQQLIHEIMRRLRATYQMRNSKPKSLGGGLNQLAIDNLVSMELKKFQYMSVTELETFLSNADLRRELKGKSVSELRAIVRSESPRNVAPTLPDEYTRSSLLKLAKTDTPAFKELIRRFGPAVNERLGVVKQSAFGTNRKENI